MVLLRSVHSASAFCLSAGVLLAATLVPVAARAATQTWKVSSGYWGDWSYSGNWSGGIPRFSDVALIDNGGTAAIAQSGPTCGTLSLGDTNGAGYLQMNAGDLSASIVYCGDTGVGAVLQAGGTLIASSTISLGNKVGSNGTYNLSGSGTLSPSYLYIGYSGSGSFAQSGGKLSPIYLYVGNSGSGSFGQSAGTLSTVSVSLGNNVGSSGSCSLSGSGSFSTGNLYVGNSGSGAFTQSGGTLSASPVYLGNNVGSSGSYLLNGSGSLSIGSLHVGNSGSGSFTQSGGSSTISSSLVLGNSAGATGSYNLSGSGRLAAYSEYIANGTITHSGGSNIVSNSLAIGSSPGCVYNLSGNGVLQAATESVASSGPDGFLQTGGTNTVTSSLYIGSTSGTGSAGTYSLSGGGQLSAAGETLYSTTGSVNSFLQSGGSNVTQSLSIGAGSRYLLSGGALQLSASGTITGSGTLDGGNAAAVLAFAGSSVVDLTPASLINTGSMTVFAGPGALVIVPSGSAFAGATGPGILHTAGTPLSVAAGQSVVGHLALNDPVDCQGAVVASGGEIDLFNGLMLSGTGSVGLGSGFLVAQPDSGMTGGSLSASTHYVGTSYASGHWLTSGTAAFTHSGGTNSSTYLYIGYRAGDSGTYNLSGSGVVASSQVYVGASGAGVFNQIGGTNQATWLYLATSSSGSGTYNLSAGSLASSGVYVGYPGTALFQQTGGTTSTPYLYVGPAGCYQLSGGALAISASGGLKIAGTLDGAHSAAVLDIPANSLVDFSQATFVNTEAMNVSIGANSLFITNGTLDPGNTFASFTNNGLVHLGGTTLTLSAGQSFGGTGDITDRLDCQGTITARNINLKGGFTISASGNVNLGSGYVATDDLTSNVSGGSLNAGYHYVGYAGTGSFSLSGGYESLYTLNVGQYPGTAGTYNLSGSGFLNSIYENIGNGGTGNFVQTGGTNSAYTLTLGVFAYVGNYNLNGGMLILYNLTSYNSVLKVSGGTLKAPWYFSTTVPISLPGGGSGATFDSAGYTITLGGLLSGPGGLMKTNSGTLALNAANTYSGTTMISGGILQVGNTLALQNSTVVLSSTGGSLNLNGYSATLGGLSGDGNLAIGSGTLSVGNYAATTTYSGRLSGTGSLKKIGSGVLTLAGSNGYSGNTSVVAGTLIASTTAAVPNLLVAAPKVSVAAGATLAVGVGGLGQWTSANIDSLLAKTSVFTSGANLGFDTSGGSFAYNSNITNAGLGLVKLGGNTLVLSGSNTYSGGTIVSDGVLSVVNPWSLPDNANLSVGGNAASLFSTSIIPSTMSAVAVPEPGTLALLAAVAGGAAIRRRVSARKRRRP
jgi:fibronectin-binding autotransporter adhesin